MKNKAENNKLRSVYIEQLLW